MYLWELSAIVFVSGITIEMVCKTKRLFILEYFVVVAGFEDLFSRPDIVNR